MPTFTQAWKPVAWPRRVRRRRRTAVSARRRRGTRELSVVGVTLRDMADRIGPQAVAARVAPSHDAAWMLVDLLASIVGHDGPEVTAHLAAMSSRGSTEGQVMIVADLWYCEHPRVVDALDLLARHHPDSAVAREARKSAMRARGRLTGL